MTWLAVKQIAGTNQNALKLAMNNSWLRISLSIDQQVMDDIMSGE